MMYTQFDKHDIRPLEQCNLNTFLLFCSGPGLELHCIVYFTLEHFILIVLSKFYFSTYVTIGHNKCLNLTLPNIMHISTLSCRGGVGSGCEHFMMLLD